MARKVTIRKSRGGIEFKQKVLRANGAAVKEIAKLYDRELQKRLSKPGPKHSKPGQSPRYQRDIKGKRSGRHDVKVRSNARLGTVTVRVGKNAFWLGWWDDPKRGGKQRPWLRRTFSRLTKRTTRIRDKHYKREQRRKAKAAR